MKINKISIKNFKVIKDLEFEPKMINVLVGKNNMGKTSILEAIDIIFNKWRLLDRQRYYRKHFLKLINIHAKSARISASASNQEFSTELHTSEPKAASDTFKKELFERFKVFQTVMPGVTEEVLKEIEKTIDLSVDDDITKEILKESITTSRIGDNAEVYINFSSDRIRKVSEYLGEIVSKNVEEKFGLKIDKQMLFLLFQLGWRDHGVGSKTSRDKTVSQDKITFIGQLKNPPYRKVNETVIHRIEETLNKLGFIKNLERFSFDEVVIKSKDGLKEIPYDFLGGGLKSIIELLSILYSGGTDERVVLIDEVETGMHPGYINHLTKFIIKMSMEMRIQFFLVSHSIDFIESFLDTSSLSDYEKKYVDKELLLIRMEATENGIILPKFSTYNDAIIDKDQLLLDLRGI